VTTGAACRRAAGDDRPGEQRAEDGAGDGGDRRQLQAADEGVEVRPAGRRPDVGQRRRARVVDEGARDDDERRVEQEHAT
jgi:hypothetical protein